MATRRIKLVPQSPAQLRALTAGASVYERQFGLRIAEGVDDFMRSPEVSPEFAAKLKTATAPDPWTYGFAVFHDVDQSIIGFAGFKGPPDANGMVEIAYGIVPGYQGQGYATEAAEELIDYARKNARVRTVRAHTLPAANASTRILQRCGFTKVGEVMDPEDGLVWRWERLYE